MTPKDVMKFVKEQGAKFADFKFMDFPGMWQHFTVPIARLTESSFEEGFGFDGSSIRGWQAIHASDMLIIPDADTAVMDPFTAAPTISFICNIVDPITKERYTRDPRNIAQKAEAYLKSTGIARHRVLRTRGGILHLRRHPVRLHAERRLLFHRLGGRAVEHRPGGNPEPRLQASLQGRLLPGPPHGQHEDIRSEMVLVMEKVGIAVEAQHHEVATGGQAEIDMQFNSLTKIADSLMWFKYIIKNVARRHGKTVTLMPKPLFGDNGTGCIAIRASGKAGSPSSRATAMPACPTGALVHRRHPEARRRAVRHRRPHDQLLQAAGAGL